MPSGIAGSRQQAEGHMVMTRERVPAEETMSDKIYEVPADWKQRAYIKQADYRAMYERSVKDPNGFWAEQGRRIHWYRTPTRIKNTSFDPHNVSIKWFEDGVT